MDNLSDINSITIEQIREMLDRLSPIELMVVTEYLQNGYDSLAAAKKLNLTHKEVRNILELSVNPRTICVWYMNKYAMPVEEIMSRMGSLARIDIGPYLMGIKRTIYNRNGDRVDEVEEISIDLEQMKRDGVTYWIRAVKYDKEGRLNVEFHDSSKALATLAKAAGVFDTMAKFNIDWDRLSPDQVQRIANGEDPRVVMAQPMLPAGMN